MQRLIGQKSEKVVGLGIFGIRTVEVLVKDLGRGSLTDRIIDGLKKVPTNDIPTMSEKALKMPSSPGALSLPREKAASLSSYRREFVQQSIVSVSNTRMNILQNRRRG